MTDTAELFVAGRSQAVWIPQGDRFEGNELFIRRDPKGEVVLSRKPESWDEFLELAERTDMPADFMADRQDAPAPERDF